MQELSTQILDQHKMSLSTISLNLSLDIFQLITQETQIGIECFYQKFPNASLDTHIDCLIYGTNENLQL